MPEPATARPRSRRPPLGSRAVPDEAGVQRHAGCAHWPDRAAGRATAGVRDLPRACRAQGRRSQAAGAGRRGGRHMNQPPACGGRWPHRPGAPVVRGQGQGRAAAHRANRHRRRCCPRLDLPAGTSPNRAARTAPAVPRLAVQPRPSPARLVDRGGTGRRYRCECPGGSRRAPAIARGPAPPAGARTRAARLPAMDAVSPEGLVQAVQGR